MEVLFWCSSFLIIYSYLIYPILLTIFSFLFNKKSEKNLSGVFPDVAVVIAAYNEESCIQQRIENLLTLDYPKDKITFYIGSDGSSDNTNEILYSFSDPRLKATLFEKNRGKATVLNNLVEMVNEPIVVFSDANTHFETDVINNFVAHFNNPNIGCVCGELNLFNPGNNDNKDGIYWRYEQYLKEKESKLDALLGANGAIYAIRKSLYTPIPENTVVDDFLIVMNIAKTKYEILYDKKTLAHEEIAPSIAEESKRRIRIGTGNYQAFSQLKWALNPMIGWRFFSYVSHKVLRWFTPHFMIVCLISNFFLLHSSFYLALLILQVLLYVTAFIGGHLSNKQQKLPSLIAFITFFVSMNFSLLIGFYRYIFKNVQGTWQRTVR